MRKAQGEATKGRAVNLPESGWIDLIELERDGYHGGKQMAEIIVVW